jgi:electron transfer flavoprotein alpha/beta subunit
LKAIMGAKKKPQERLSAADLGISDGSRTEVLALSTPPAKAGGVRIEDEGGSSAEQILAFLVERKLVV